MQIIKSCIIIIQFLWKCSIYVDGCYVFARDVSNPCAKLQCTYGATCIMTADGSAARCECPERCPSYGDHDMSRPLCGTDGRDYANQCEMMREACISGTKITARHVGKCPEIITTTMEETTPPPSTTVTTTFSPLITEELLASTSHLMMHNFEKEVCKDIYCDFSAICELGPDDFPRCTCRFECEKETDDTEPVCASDLRIYTSLCAMKMEACQRQQDLRLRPLDLCQGAEVKPCKGKTPLKSSMTGLELDCGNGALRQDCPSGSYCQQTTSFARCCPKDQNLEPKDCATSWFGCCSDGVTFATTADRSGCPSTCKCNRLGSYEDTCDPVTLQCRCRPGVGGLHCDRCEPGYWGLPKISTGLQGCIPCGCSPYGSVREDCEQMTGRCVCKPDIQGQKCTVCTSHNKVLGPHGCVASTQHSSVPTGTEWPLKAYTSFEYTQSDDLNSPLSKSTRHLLYPYPPGPEREQVHYNMVVPDDAHANRMSFHPGREDPGHREDFKNVDNHDSKGSYHIPYFDGEAYMRLKTVKAYYKLDLELEFKTNKPNGMIFYNGQRTDGTGDFVSLALINGYLEFRYNLGDGAVVLTSPERLAEGCFHTVSARRYNQDGALRVDSGYAVAGHARGTFKGLDLKEDAYVGYILANHSRVYENIGTRYGFDGCIKKFKINKRLVDLWVVKDDSVLGMVRVKDCEQTPCSNISCNNNNNITCVFKETHTTVPDVT